MSPKILRVEEFNLNITRVSTDVDGRRRSLASKVVSLRTTGPETICHKLNISERGVKISGKSSHQLEHQ